jgi:hypothetical protein
MMRGPTEEKQKREEFDTGLGKIRHEIKSRLVPHGLFGNVTYVDIDTVDEVPAGSKIEIAVKGRTVGRSFIARILRAAALGRAARFC